ncbi:two-component regulator propeller domain-containing protein [Chitinophaga sp. MM2321]|uniref:two-component regulator propeller domain-containing protein n=1 Tax=Chitinophaga sp. MM2321 TaxID=3137178 RepID=UPI0032D59425
MLFKTLRTIVLVLMVSAASAQTTNYNFYNHSTDNGLLTNDYQKIIHDSYGFIWLASFDGLFRWDGYSIKKYGHQEKDSLSLNNNIVYSIFEDSHRRLWVGTIDGLNLYDRSRDVFERMPINGQKNKTPINAIIEDAQQQLWLGTSNGLCRYDAAKRKGDWFLAQGDENVIFCMAAGPDNNIWAGTFNKGVLKFNTRTHSFRSFRNSPDNPNALPSNKIQSILLDKAQRVWIGTEDKGVGVLDSLGNLLGAFDNLSHSPRFTHSNIRCIYQDADENIWIGVGREDLCLVNKGTFTPMPVSSQAQNNGHDRVNSITSITEDQFGNIWFASAGYGIFTTNSKKNVFSNYLTSNNDIPGLRTTVVTSFYEDIQHRLWIGTAGSGVVLYDPAKPNHALQAGPLFGSMAVNDVKGDRAGHIWVATWAEGLKEYDPATGQTHSYLHDPLNANSLINNDVKTILPDDSVLWIGTHGEGLVAYQLNNRQFIHYKNNTVYPFNMQEPAWVNHLFKDSRKRIWISTYSGLFIYNGKTLQHYEHSDNPASINGNSVNMVAEDQQGRIWVVTEQGLDRFDETSQSFTHLNKQLPLPESMKSIICDAENKLWISTNEGLISLDPATLQTHRYDKNDGLYEKTFFQKAALKGDDGTLYFGGPKGFSGFNPARITPVNTPVYFYFTDLYIFGELQQPGAPKSPLQKILGLTDTLTLTQKQSYFSIGFAAINLYAPPKIKYSYRLEGYYDEWIDVIDERKISFAHLQPGTYRLQVRYTDTYGAWQPPGRALTIIIQPYWWQTWWFKTGLAMIIILGITTIFYQRIATVKKRNQQLKEEVRRQTARLQETNNSLVEQNDEITMQKEKLEVSYSEIVRQTDKILVQQQQISNQNQELEKAVEELEKVNKSKDYFFSVLAHDLKNPVVALKELSGFMEAQLGKTDTRTLQQYVANMHASSSAVFDLLVNLLSWSMSQSQRMDYAPVDANVAAIVQNNLKLLSPQITNKNIAVTQQLDEQHWIYADQQMVDVVIRNILSNSVKFTGYNGAITITSTTTPENIMLRISDTGIGMTQEQLDELFHINKSSVQTGTAGEKGTGLGLLIVKDFLEVNHASITVSSEPGKGSIFTLTFPISNNPPVALPVAEESGSNALTAEFWQALPTETYLKIKGKKILIVEDSKEMRDYLRLLLSDVFEIFEAENGEQGLSLALEELPAIIVTDLLMPGMNGLQFCKSIKSQTVTSHIPVIILTSQWETGMQASGYEAGAEAYLTKPIKKEVLLQVLLNFLQKQDTIYQRVRDQIFNDTPLPADSHMISDMDQQFLHDLIHFIEANMSNAELDAKLISKALCVSRTVLYNKVKSLAGQTVHEFIKAIRLRKGVQLLLEGNLTINQVAFEVGFNSHSYFDKCFIKQYGVGPKEFIARKKAVR